MDEPAFLHLDEVLALHELSLREHGGLAGIRDQAGLESAVAQTRQDYFYAAADLHGIAAAYAFHLSESQSFVDGNKRTAMASALFFLKAHGFKTKAPTEVLYGAMISLAKHDLDKPGLAALFRGLFHPK
jgi:death-on-curing protein